MILFFQDDKFGTWTQWLRFYDGSLGPVRRLSQGVVPEAIQDLGTKQHEKLISKFVDGTVRKIFPITKIFNNNLKFVIIIV